MKRKYKESDCQEQIRPGKRHKYYLRNRWIFTIIAVIVVIIFSVVKASYHKQQLQAGVVSATILRVVDGDTIVVILNGKEERIRMIGVDAPESVSAEESENSVYGELASVYTKECLNEGRVIYLTFDREERDQYDRMLAYVWLDDDVNNSDNLFQKQLVEEGYALAIHYEPNTLYWYVLKDAMNKAILDRRGLWSDEEFYKINCGSLIE